MRCVRVDVPGEPLVVLHHEPIPEAPDTGAVVKVSYCGVCHTDVHFWEGGYALSNGQTMRFQDRPGFKVPLRTSDHDDPVDPTAQFLTVNATLHSVIMRCVRVDVPGEPLVVLHHEPIPEAPDTGAVVKVSYCGVCHTDVHFWEGGYALSNGQTMRFQDRPGFKYPCVPGHEICGVVFSLGKDATNDDDLKLGDSVVAYPWFNCNSCRACVNGYNNSCDEVPPSYLGMTQDGGFADYVAVPDVRYLVPIPTSIPLPIASQLPCGGLTAFHAVEEGMEFVKTLTQVKGNCCVLIFGAGGLGQWGVRFARALFPPETQIICADIKQRPLDEVTNEVKDVVPILSRNQTTEETVQQVKTASISGHGVDLILDFVGLSATFSVAKNSMRMPGRYHVVGLLGGQATFPLTDMVLNRMTMHGIKIGSFVQLKKLVKLLAKMPSVWANLTYSVHPLVDAQSVMQQLIDGKVTGRAVLRCGDSDR